MLFNRKMGRSSKQQDTEGGEMTSEIRLQKGDRINNKAHAPQSVLEQKKPKGREETLKAQI